MQQMFIVPFVIVSISNDHSGDFSSEEALIVVVGVLQVDFPCSVVVPRLVPTVHGFNFEGFRVSCGPLVGLRMLQQ